VILTSYKALYPISPKTPWDCLYHYLPPTIHIRMDDTPLLTLKQATTYPPSNIFLSMFYSKSIHLSISTFLVLLFQNLKWGSILSFGPTDLRLVPPTFGESLRREIYKGAFNWGELLNINPSTWYFFYLEFSLLYSIPYSYPLLFLHIDLFSTS
jgi:hypothetical protein